MKHLITFWLALLSLSVFSTRAGASTSITSHSYYFSASCGTVFFYIGTAGCTTSDSLMAYFGDGTDDIFVDSCSGSIGMVNFTHTYLSSGSYTVKLVAYSGTLPEDSVTFTVNINFCRQLPISVYNDLNSNCTHDVTDANVNAPSIIKVDSAGTPIDTVSMLYGMYYTAYGPPGTVYTFRVLTPPAGMVATCPSSGIVTSTVPAVGVAATLQQIGYECVTTADYDLSLSASFRPAIAGGGANVASVVVYNSNCAGTPTPAVLKFEYSTKYSFGYVTPATLAYTVTGTSVSVSLGTITPTSPSLVNIKLIPVLPLTLGDTANTRFSVTPVTGDVVPTNNVIVRCDTVIGAYDPNQKSVTPPGPISAGQHLEYLLEFENQGNDTAYNIHILDTLSDYLDINTLQMVGSTHAVSLIRYIGGGKNILKFDFSDIRLPDSSHHDYCRGSVAFSINAKSTLALGTVIPNRVGIYFDTNPAIMTNTVYSNIPFPAGVANTRLSAVELYPNPVSNLLHISTDGQYSTLTIYNIVGQVVSTMAIQKSTTAIDVQSYRPGMYYATLRGVNGTKTVKFEKQ